MKSLFKKILFFSFLFTASVNLFAQVPKGLESLGDTVLGIFTGNLVKTILICCLAGCGVAYGFNKDNEKMKRNIIAIAIAIAIVVGASEIVKLVWDAS